MSNSTYLFHLSELLEYRQLSDYTTHPIPKANDFARWIVANQSQSVLTSVFEALSTAYRQYEQELRSAIVSELTFSFSPDDSHTTYLYV